MNLPVCVFVDTVEQKWHLRWQCVIVPSRSPDVSMHAADRSRKMGGMGGRGENKNKCVGLFAQQTKFYRSKKVPTYPVILWNM